MKHCPVCDSNEWEYDITDGWFTYCNSCYDEISKVLHNTYKQNQDGLYKLSDLFRAIAEARDNHKS